MRSTLVICSAASLVLISVFMAESFKKTNVREVSEVESSAAMATADPSIVPQATQVIANLVFMVFPYCSPVFNDPAKITFGPFVDVHMPHSSWACWLVGSLINTCLGRQPPGAGPTHDPTQFGRRVGYACHRTDVSVIPPGRTGTRRRISAMRSSF